MYFKKNFPTLEQESTGNARLYDGTGLGLSASRKKFLLICWAGHITIESEKNFFFFFSPKGGKKNLFWVESAALFFPPKKFCLRLKISVILNIK